MKRRVVTLVAGDGTGAALAPHVKALLDAAGAAIEWDEQVAGVRAWRATGDPLPPAVFDAIRRNEVALHGWFATPPDAGYSSPAIRLRQQLDLYAGVRPVRNLPGLRARFSGLDVVMIRELTEDVYSGIEHEVAPGVVQSLKVTTRRACERIARYAFEYATTRGRRRVTLVHKANIMKKADGLFLATAREVAASYPGVAFDHIIADNCAMQLVRNPHRFDVLLLGNLFGDILTDLGAGIAGGAATGWGVATDGDIHVFEAIHGFDPPAGPLRVNPLLLLRPAIALVDFIGQPEVSERLTAAVRRVLERGEPLTPDLGGTATTREMVEAIARALEEA